MNLAHQLALARPVAEVEEREVALAPAVGHVGDGAVQNAVDGVAWLLIPVLVHGMGERTVGRLVHLDVVLAGLAAGPVEEGLDLRLGGQRVHLGVVAVDGAGVLVAVPTLGLVLGGELAV